MSMKNSNDTIGNQTHDLPTCSAVPQPFVLDIKIFTAAIWLLKQKVPYCVHKALCLDPIPTQTHMLELPFNLHAIGFILLCAPEVGILTAYEKNLALGLLDCTTAATQQGLLIMVKGGAAVDGRTLINKVQNIYSILYNINFTHVKDECRNIIHSQNHPPSAPKTETNGSH
jgi:hypothetical protein